MISQDTQAFLVIYLIKNTVENVKEKESTRFFLIFFFYFSKSYIDTRSNVHGSPVTFYKRLPELFSLCQ